jgi:hypothetical protein
MLKRIGNRIETAPRRVRRFPEADGVISSEQDNGFIVQRIALEDVDPLYPIKISLEGLACRLPFLSFAKILRE